MDTIQLKLDGIRIAQRVIKQNHYAHSVSSGKSYYFCHKPAYIVYSIPANPYITGYLLGVGERQGGVVWELSRLWAPDGHERNLLTQAISGSVRLMKKLVKDLDAIVSYADPNVGHGGGVYRAASWIYAGQSEEGRYYRSKKTGQVVSRRKFHCGSAHLNKAEILALGFDELKKPGKHRFVFPVSKRAKKAFERFHGCTTQSKEGLRVL